MGLFKLFKGKRNSDQTREEREPEVLEKIDKDTSDIEGIKTEVEPELALWLANGTTAKSLAELASALKKMSAADYKEHVDTERNEIAEWVQEVLNDQELARSLRKAKSKMQAAQQIEKEIKTLKAEASKPVAVKKEKAQNAKRQPRLQASKVELPLPEIAELQQPETSATKAKFSLWPFRKKPAMEEETETMTELKELEVPQFPDLKMPEEDEIKIEEKTEEARIENPAPEKRKGFLFPTSLFRRGPIGSGRFGFKRKQGATKQEEVIEPLENLPQPSTMEAPEPAENMFEPEPQHEKWTEQQEPEEEIVERPIEEVPIQKTRKQPKVKAGKAKTRLDEDAGLQRRMRELEAKEKALDMEEEQLNSKKLEATRKRYELIKQKGDLERERFEEFMRKHKLVSMQGVSVVTTGEEMPQFSAAENDQPMGETSGLPDFRLSGAYGKERLEELLEQAKQSIRENNVEEAQKALHEVQSVFNTVFMTTTEKKQIEYDILEVEADLKLASLR